MQHLVEGKHGKISTLNKYQEKEKNKLLMMFSLSYLNFQMSIKRKIEDNQNESGKKTKLHEIFSIELFVKRFKDAETCFLGKHQL